VTGPAAGRPPPSAGSPALPGPTRLRLRARSLPLGGQTHVMGIVNLTGDSFTRIQFGADVAAAAARAREMAAEGVAVVDIGAESTQARETEPLSPGAELERLVPVLEALADPPLPAALSVDTWKAEVARRVLEYPVDLINDVTGLAGDPELAAVVAGAGAAVCLQHQAVPHQNEPVRYGDVYAEVLAFFEAAVGRAEAAGIAADSILLDPGFGFQKDVHEDLEITRRLGDFRRDLGKPVLHAPSRKKTIGVITGHPDQPEARLWGTAAAAALSVAFGADVLRVHDTRAMLDVIRLADALVRGYTGPGWYFTTVRTWGLRQGPPGAGA